MKTKALITSLVASATIVLATNAAETITPPPTGDSVTSSAVNANVKKGLQAAGIKANVLASGQPAVVSVTPLLMVNIDSPSWPAAADKAIADALAGTITTRTSITVPTDYAICDFKIAWSNLVESTTVPMWGGMLNPPSPFNNELGGPLVWQLLDARATSGQNELSLDMLSLTTVSSDGNALGDTISFNGDSYTARAIAINANGTTNSSGVASEKGVRVLALTCTKLFNGGDTQDRLTAVNTWVNQKSPYKITYTAMVGGDGTTASFATVSTITPPVLPAAPTLAIVNNGNGSGIISLSGATATEQYQILSSASVLGPWSLVGLVTANGAGKGSLAITAGASAQFYRAKAQ